MIVNISRVFCPKKPERFFRRTEGGEKVDIGNITPNESQDQLLKRFRKKVAKSGILSTVRRKRWFVLRVSCAVSEKKSIRRFKRRTPRDTDQHKSIESLILRCTWLKKKAKFRSKNSRRGIAGDTVQIRLDNGHEVLAYLSGKMRKHYIRILLGDRYAWKCRPMI